MKTRRHRRATRDDNRVSKRTRLGPLETRNWIDYMCIVLYVVLPIQLWYDFSRDTINSRTVLLNKISGWLCYSALELLCVLGACTELHWSGLTVLFHRICIELDRVLPQWYTCFHERTEFPMHCNIYTNCWTLTVDGLIGTLCPNQKSNQTSAEVYQITSLISNSS